ncbi:hypothetical protein [uncultured Rikenella sp.]|uniref:LolA family protein n=1 Tax=uncultured Rikenella sp. TaxID=368003 RepID=UPI00261D0EC2|nr:hypothetical protein [uncultured Rikenella sp.]
MKRLFQWIAVFCIGLVAVPVSAQDGALEVIDRYERVTGLDKLTPADMTSVMMEVVTETQGRRISMKMIVKEPGKFNVDMEIAGQKVKMVFDGSQGWVSVPGQGVMPMPAESLEQLRKQTNLSQHYRWNRTDYDYRMAGEVEKDGHTCVGVEMMPKKAEAQMIDRTIVYFDKDTGLVAYAFLYITQGGKTVPARMDFTDYKTFGMLKLPSRYKLLVGGAEMMNMEIKTLEYDYPTTDAMFVRPE